MNSSSSFGNISYTPPDPYPSAGQQSAGEATDLAEKSEKELENSLTPALLETVNVDEDIFQLINKKRINNSLKELEKKYSNHLAAKINNVHFLKNELMSLLQINESDIPNLSDGALALKYSAHLNNKAAFLSSGPMNVIEEIGTKITLKVTGKVSTSYFWNQRDFLVIHILLLIELYIKVKKNYLELPSPLNKDKIEFIIKNEVWLTANAFHIFQSYKIIVDSAHTDQIRLGRFIRNFISAISYCSSEIQPGEELIFPCGTVQHAIYIAFEKLDKAWRLRIDNTGAGVEKFSTLKNRDTKKVQSCAITKIDEKEIQNHKDFNTYLTNVCLAITQTNEDGLSAIYNKAHPTLDLPPVELLQIEYPSFPLQVHNHCVSENFIVGMKNRLLRLDNDSFVDWLLSELCAMALVSKNVHDQKDNYSALSAMTRSNFQREMEDQNNPTIQRENISPPNSYSTPKVLDDKNDRKEIKYNLMHLDNTFDVSSSINKSNFSFSSSCRNFMGFFEEKIRIIDKTLFIKDIFEDKPTVILILRPRRFGKSTNLFMLRDFFDIQTKNKAQEVFPYLKIGIEYPEFLLEMGGYPVIFITFATINKFEDYSEAHADFLTLLSDLYNNYRDILINELTASEAKDYEKIIKKNLNKDNSQDKSIINSSLMKLSAYLHHHYKKKVIFLLDELDTPIYTSFGTADYKKIVTFICLILNPLLKDNPHLKKSVLTGILSVISQKIFQDLNLKVYSVLDDKYGSYFGFSYEEIQFSLAVSNHNTINRLKKWYGGYTIDKVEVFNPCSILHFLHTIFHNGQQRMIEDKDFDRYWVKNAGLDFVIKLFPLVEPNVKVKFKQLIEGKTILHTINDHITSENVTKTETFFTILLFTGYLTYINLHFNEYGERIYELSIPNHELWLFYFRQIQWQDTDLKPKSPFFHSIENEHKKLSIDENQRRIIDDKISSVETVNIVTYGSSA